MFNFTPHTSGPFVELAISVINSLNKKINSAGDNGEPSGTPTVNFCVGSLVLDVFTEYVSLLSILVKIDTNLLEAPLLISLLSSRLRSVDGKALLMSRRIV